MKKRVVTNKRKNLDFCDVAFLSPNVAFRVLDYLTIEDLANLANTCQGLQLYILNLAVQKNFQQSQFVAFRNEDEEVEEVETMRARRWTGSLKDAFGFATLLAENMSRRTLIKLLENFTEIIDHSQEKNHWKLLACPTNQAINSKSVLLLCFGILFSKVTRDLCNEDLEDFIDEVLTACHLKSDVETLMANDYEVGSDNVVECKIRNFLYFCFWKKTSEQNKGDILSSILDVITGGCSIKKAMMLYLMFGPIKKVILGTNGEITRDVSLYLCVFPARKDSWDVVSWVTWDEVTCHASEIFRSALREAFGPVSRAIDVLFSSKAELLTDHDYHCDFMQILNNLFEGTEGKRNKWDIEYVATVLLLASQDFREWFLINGHVMATADMEIVSNMVVLAAKFQMAVEPVSRLLHNVVGVNIPLPSCQKFHMIESFWSELTDCLQRLIHDEDVGGQGSSQSQVILFVAELGRKMMPMAYPLKEENNSFVVGAKKRKIEVITFSSED